MRKGNKGIGKILPGILIICLMAGCESADLQNEQSGSSRESQVKQREKQSGQIEEGEHEALTICTANINYTYFLEALHEKYPEINLEFTSYKGANSGGYMRSRMENEDIPDIFTSEYMPRSELQEQYLVNLSTYDFVNNYSDTMLDEVEVNGEVFMIPSGYQVAGINYNKTLFQEYGWEVPQSFEELEALAEQIRSDAPDVTPVVARMSQKEYPFQYFFALGGTEFLGTIDGTKWKNDFLEGSTTAEGNIESCAEYLEKWIDAGFITDYDLNGADILTEFYDGKIAMLLGTETDKWSGISKSTGEAVEVGIMAWPGENGNHGMLLRSVSRYYGISKKLEESGNEQKLEDALKLLEFISSEEGQIALCAGNTTGVVFPFEDYDLNDDSELSEVRDDIEGGYTIPMTYADWADDLLAPMADEIIKLVQGEIDTTELLSEFDRINQTLQENPESYDYAELDDNLTQEQTARLVGMALIDGTDADVALVSLGGITDDGNYLENSVGVQCGIYAGGINDEILNIFRPNSSQLAVIDLTGKEILDLADQGRELCADPEVLGTEYTYLTEPVTYYMPYVLVAKDDENISEDKTYRVVFAASDYSDRIAGEWGDRLTILSDESPADALIAWLKKQPDGHFGEDALEW
jgi:raffinose/stachyose/melibiose transport system substrate-binding protein